MQPIIHRSPNLDPKPDQILEVLDSLLANCIIRVGKMVAGRDGQQPVEIGTYSTILVNGNCRYTMRTIRVGQCHTFAAGIEPGRVLRC